MAKEPEQFWEGGSWEQPTSRYQIPKSPDQNLSRHIKRSQSFRSGLRLVLHALRWGVVVGLVIVLIYYVILGFSGLSFFSVPSVSGSSSSGGSGGGGGGVPDGYYVEDSNVVTDPLLPQADPLTEDIISLNERTSATLTPQEIYSQVEASVVYIETLTSYGIGAGTGVIISEDGYIVTNAHVISDAIDAVVTLWDETSYSASVVGWDVDEDLAVLKIDAEGLSPATFGDSSDLVVGDTAYAIGNPLGSEYRSTFTDGIISAIDRYLDIDGVYMSLIQTTTPINMGNSGGALLNDKGEVVGITTIKIMSSSDTIESMGFAIPSTRVVKVVNCLAQGIELVTPALGITVYEITTPIRGLLIDSVAENSYADEAGLQTGDILTHAAGTPLNYSSDLMQIKDSLLVGDTLTVTVYRDGISFNLDVVLSDYAEVHPDS